MQEGQEEQWIKAEDCCTKRWCKSVGTVLQKWDYGISWDKVTNLTRFSSRDAVREEMLRVYPSNDSHLESLGMWEFSHVMKPGDILFPKRNITLLGLRYGSNSITITMKKVESIHI